MRTAGKREMAAKAAGLRRKSLVSQTLYSIGVIFYMIS